MKPSANRKQLRAATSAALFWGDCLKLLNDGRLDELRQILIDKAKARLEDVDRLKTAIASGEGKQAP